MMNNEEILLYAIENNDLNEVKKLLKEGMEPNLRIAINQKEPNEEIIKTLLENGADPNFKIEFGKSMLHELLYQGHYKQSIIELFFLHKADPNLKDDNGLKKKKKIFATFFFLKKILFCFILFFSLKFRSNYFTLAL